jgi:hypothetical protein
MTDGENTLLKDVVAEWLTKDDPEAAEELGLSAAPAAGVSEPVAEDAEDRISYQVARYLFDKGARYSPENEKHLIKQIGGAMMKMGVAHKTIRYLMSYDEDFLSDTLGELKNMEHAVNELAEDSKEDTVLPKTEKNAPDEGNLIKQVAEMVKSFYNRNHKEQGLGPFPKGEEGVVIHVRKELGDKAGDLAERFVAKLAGQADEGADMDQIPAYVRKQKQQSQDVAQKATDTRNQQSGAKVWSNPRLPKESSEMESILKLAGLAK